MTNENKVSTHQKNCRDLTLYIINMFIHNLMAIVGDSEKLRNWVYI